MSKRSVAKQKWGTSGWSSNGRKQILRKMFGVTNDECAAFLAACTSQPTIARKDVIDQTYTLLKAANVLSELDYLHIYAAHDSQAATLNWVNPATYTAVPVNSPTFTTDRGFNGNGSSSYVRTGFSPTVSTKHQPATHSFGLRVNADLTNAATIDFGGNAADTVGNLLTIRDATNRGRARSSSSSYINIAAASATSRLHMIERTASGSFTYFKAAAADTTFSSLASSATASASGGSVEWFLGCFSDNGTPASFAPSSRVYSVSWAGGAVDKNALLTALKHYADNVGLN